MAVSERLAFLLSLDADSAIKGFNKVGDAADKNLSKTDERIKKASLSLSSFGTKALAVSGVAAVGLAKTAGAFADLALAAGKFSDAAGISVEEASRLIAVGDDLGISAETMQVAFQKLNKSVATGATSIKEYGIEVARTEDGVVDANQTFLNAIDVVGRIEDPTKRAQAAQELFGRSYGEIAELIETGAGDVKTALESVSDAQVISPAELEKARSYRAAMDELGDSFSDLVVSIGQGVAPAISGLATGVAGLIGFFGKADAVTGGLVGKLAGFGVAGLAVAGSISFVAGKVLGMVDTFKNLGSRLRTTEGALTKTGTAVAGFGLVTAAFAAHAYTASQNAKGFQSSVEALGRATDEELIEGLPQLIQLLGEVEFEKMAQASLGGAIRVRDLARANEEFATALDNAGLSLSEINAIIAAETAAQARMNAVTESGTEAVEGLDGALAGVEGSQAAANDQVDRGADAMRGLTAAEIEAAQEAGFFTDEIEKTRKATDLMRESVSRLQGLLSDRDAYDNSIQAQNELIWANQVAIDTAKNQKATEQEKAAALDASKAAIRRSIDETLVYISTVGGIPPSKETEITALLDEGKYQEAEAFLTHLARARTVFITAKGQGSLGFMKDAQGTSSSPGGMTIVGERGPELLNIPSGSEIRSFPQLRADLSGASGGTIYNTINVQTLTGRLPPETIREIEDALARNSRWNGRG